MKDIVVLLTILLIIYILFQYAKRSERSRHIFSFVTAFVFCVYLIWRGLFTLPFDSVISFMAGLTLYLSEIIGLMVYCFFVFLFGQKTKYVPNTDFVEDFLPKVCVFVCTYNEDLNLVMATALAAKGLPYPNKEVYICDDGHRKEFRDTCERFGIHYLSRPDNKNAKAGNINYALSQTESDLIMVLDADFIVKDRFIYDAVYCFVDEDVALVQYPQTFYNKDPFQMASPRLYNEQELFMRYLEPALAKQNAIIHIGTNAILRRSAIEKIGGIPVASITEDMATGYLMQSEGLKTVYLNMPHALGITPYTLKDLSAQRKRWAKGTVQIFKHYKPVRDRNLSMIQRLCYFNSYMYWFTSFQKLVYLLIPTLFLNFDIFIVRNDLESFIIFFIPPIIMIILSFRLYAPKVRTFMTSHVYDCFVAPVHAAAIIEELLATEKQFHVTDKQITKENRFDLKTVRAHICMAIWIAIAIGFGFYKVFQGGSYLYGYLITLAWSLYNFVGLIYVIKAAIIKDAMSDADALSIMVNEKVYYQSHVFSAIQMNYMGLRIKVNTENDLNLFTLSEMYEIFLSEEKIQVNTQCISIEGDEIIFAYKNLDINKVQQLTTYYSRKLHANKPLDMDFES